MELYFAELEPLIICRTRGEDVNHYATNVVCVFYMFSIYGFNISCIEWHFLCKCNAQLYIYQIKALYHWPLNLWRLLWLHWSLGQYNLLALKIWKYNKIGYICLNNWWHIRIHSYVKWIDVFLVHAIIIINVIHHYKYRLATLIYGLIQVEIEVC